MTKIETKCGKCGSTQFLDAAPSRTDGWYGTGCSECHRSYSTRWVDGKVVESRAWAGVKEVKRAGKSTGSKKSS